MAPMKAKFADNEKLLCYHGPLLYEAKCVKSKKDGNSFSYFIHYQGWNKNWDEWVGETRILKINSENLDKKEKLLSSHLSTVKENKKKDKARQSSSGGSAPGTPVPGERGSTSTGAALTPVELKMDHQSPYGQTSLKDTLGILNEEESESELGPDEEYFGRASSAKFEISIPEELKYVLMSDWDLISHQKSLFALPAKIPASNILSDFVRNAEKLSADPKSNMTEVRLNMTKEVAQGIQGFFDTFVGHHLLYNQEKVQFQEEVLKETAGKAPSDIYGSAHLLRLMVRIGPLLDRYNIREESDVRIIESLILDFLQYLEVNRSKYFTSKNYVEATEEYLAKTPSGVVDPIFS